MIDYSDTLFITGAGVSAESGIPTFRGREGYWTMGSANYTPQQMATRSMYRDHPGEFLRWYFQRFATYRNHGPNAVHEWLADKNLITQNIDGLDGKAGNKNYIAIHGRLDKMTPFHHQGQPAEIIAAPWDTVDPENETESLLELFHIDGTPEINRSFKPYVLLFDEMYTELYRVNEAQQRMYNARRIVFIGTSFSVNITQMALDIGRLEGTPIEIVDPEPVDVMYPNAIYHRMTARAYIDAQVG